MESDWITRDEAAAILGIDKRNVEQRVKRGHLRQITVPKGTPYGCTTRFSRAECEAARHLPWPPSRRDYPYDRAPSIADCAYFAGFFDGEGTIRISCRPKTISHAPCHCLQLSLYNVHTETMQWVHQTFGGSMRRASLSKMSNYHEALNWYAAPQTALHILRLLIPYLKVKRRQAEIAIAYQEHRNQHPHCPSHPVPQEELEWREQQKALISALNQGSCVSCSEPAGGGIPDRKGCG